MLDKSNGKKLYGMVKAMSKKLHTAKIHQIVIDSQMNAALYQHPRLGILGFYRNYLIIGLPLLMALSAEEVKSVIAHELGHLSGNDSKFGNRIYRQKRTWNRILNTLQGSEKSIWVFKKFASWYVPFFNAYTFVLMRKQEYRADQIAATEADGETAIRALLKIDTGATYLSKTFWKNIGEMTKQEPEPIKQVFTLMQQGLHEDIHKEIIEQVKTEILARKTQSLDTHPVATDRAKALGVQLDFNFTLRGTAFEELLPNSEFYLEHFNQKWRQEIYSQWRYAYKNYEQMRARLQELEGKEQENALDDEETYEKGMLKEQLFGYEKAVAIYEEIHQARPDFVPALYALGRILLEEKDDVRGLALIERVLALDYRYTVEGCRLIHEYLVQHGKAEEARKYYEKAVEYAEKNGTN